ncbi:hypothetical protein VNI00_003153 [Paramarasmius palmivorus]|uniref:Uncharacterized protein n=1 Tax=Paramarasmius palmivorus TaxID=297713 RepID=A0AAW0DUG0_9AGAR
MSQSRSRSRTSALRAPRPEYSRTPTVLGGEDLAADGPVTAETVEYLHEFVHPHGHQVEDTLIGEEEFGGSVDLAMDSEEDGRMNLPWWKRPSPWWLIAMLPISAMAMAATIAPRVEVYTMLACRVHKPDIYYESDYYAPQLQAFGNSTTSLFQQSQLNANVHIELAKANPCAADPVVQAAVAKLAAGV